MIRTRTVLLAALAAGLVSAGPSPAKAEFFGCNTPKITHYSVSGNSYRAGSRHSYQTYSPAPRHYYGRVSHYSAYSARSYRSRW
jgi:hypothetical protein